MKKTIFKTLSLGLFLCAVHVNSLNASDITFGGQAGAADLAEGKSDTGVGFGAFVQGSALDILSLQVDYFNTKINTAKVNAFSANLVWSIVDFDELKVGLLAGPGFYELAGDPWKFGLNGGVFGEISFIENLPIGLQARYHSVFGGKDNDLWSVFMTVGYRFSTGSAW